MSEQACEAPEAAQDYPDEQIPAWCRLPLADHHDGMGGCWSLLHGYVQRWGESACVRCDYYGGNIKAGRVIAQQ